MVHVFDRFRVENGLLKSINPFWDPSPLANAQAVARRKQLVAISGVYFVDLDIREDPEP